MRLAKEFLNELKNRFPVGEEVYQKAGGGEDAASLQNVLRSTKMFRWGKRSGDFPRWFQGR
jgi:hypothetical protein